MVRSPSLDNVGASLVYRIGSTATYKKLFRYWYPLMTKRLNHGDDVQFLNWGYEEDPPLGLPLDPADEPNRYSIQLYHQTATQDGVDLAGKKVLECSSGHGGGASYLSRTLKPASYTGLDFNAAGVEFCNERHKVPGLDFVHGDAENLPFPDDSFDAVINVEASHIYPHFDRFLSEVKRVLRPGGHFLHVDFRNRDNFAGGSRTWRTRVCDRSRRESSTQKCCAASRRTRLARTRSSTLACRPFCVSSAGSSRWLTVHGSTTTSNVAKSTTAHTISRRTKILRGRGRALRRLPGDCPCVGSSSRGGLST